MQFGAFPSLDTGGVAIDARVPDDQPEEAAVAAPPDSASQLSSELAYPAAAVPAVQADVVIEPVSAATPASASQLSGERKPLRRCMRMFLVPVGARP